MYVDSVKAAGSLQLTPRADVLTQLVKYMVKGLLMQKSEQARDIALDALARLLPVFGRDFDLQIVPTAIPGKPGHFSTSVNYIPLSEMGHAIRPILAKLLGPEIEKVSIERGMHEIETIESEGHGGDSGSVDKQRLPGRNPTNAGVKDAGGSPGLQTLT